MAEPARDLPPSGRIPRDAADQIVMACLTQLASGIFEGTERETALHLLERALPLASRSSRMTTFRPIAESMLVAGTGRTTKAGASAWCRACMDLKHALARDALSRAVALVEV